MNAPAYRPQRNDAHTLKTWPEYFQRVWDGTKPFEVRRNDRGFAVGDVLHLQEYDPKRIEGRDGAFTGRELTARVTYLLEGGRFGVEKGFVVMGLTVLQRGTASTRLRKVV